MFCVRGIMDFVFVYNQMEPDEWRQTDAGAGETICYKLRVLYLETTLWIRSFGFSRSLMDVS